MKGEDLCKAKATQLQSNCQKVCSVGTVWTAYIIKHGTQTTMVGAIVDTMVHTIFRRNAMGVLTTSGSKEQSKMQPSSWLWAVASF